MQLASMVNYSCYNKIKHVARVVGPAFRYFVIVNAQAVHLCIIKTVQHSLS